MEQQIISVDSQILNSVQSCARKTKYQFVDHIQPVEKAAALEKGDLLHKPLEVYYSLKGNCVNEKSDTWKIIRAAGGCPPIGETSHTDALAFAKQYAPLFASQLSISAEDCEMVMYQFEEYCDHYKNDNWLPLATEEVGSKILFENEEFKIIYNFKIDLIAEKHGIGTIPWDHKSSSRHTFLSSMSNQFIGYAWGMGSQYVIVNKIGFQKTLPREKRFLRPLLTYSQERINEWVNNSVWWIMILHHYKQTNNWPLNLTSCDKYSGCSYEGICSKDESGRDWIINRDFKITQPWDVAKDLEEKESD